MTWIRPNAIGVGEGLGADAELQCLIKLIDDGREYTVGLQPAAVAQLTLALRDWFVDHFPPEDGDEAA
ncbi:MAG: hypothetical protein AMXMBFR46_25430 [Acidimicrobiia bacterium]